MTLEKKKELIKAIKKYGDSEYLYGYQLGKAGSANDATRTNHMSAFEEVLMLAYSLD